ncbi:hypothetical protein MPDQ_007932 [Monascus purpureus]|uniref:Scytalone dehydratase-like domain-containing protein n=1 Tax=Monascus purpureus TaxID=5098 RepID=A0A507QV32_MONPU|nr:hypothetical protein MPDQ_007932 [Monascus purpureus]
MAEISFEDYLALQGIVFEWADSYDNKDWERLRKVLAPALRVDYSIVGYTLFENMPAEEFIGMVSSLEFLGDPLVRTQHLMGAAKYERISDTEITVENRGHGHSFIKHWYKKVDGSWKLAGLCPKVYWNEHRFDKIFVQLPVKN